MSKTTVPPKEKVNDLKLKLEGQLSRMVNRLEALNHHSLLQEKDNKMLSIELSWDNKANAISWDVEETQVARMIVNKARIEYTYAIVKLKQKIEKISNTVTIKYYQSYNNILSKVTTMGGYTRVVQEDKNGRYINILNKKYYFPKGHLVYKFYLKK
jgi:TusA-related sulfurtransferase